MATSTATTTENDIGLTNLKLTGHHPASGDVTGASSKTTQSVRQSSPPEEPSHPSQNHKVKWAERTQFFALCFCLFLAGYNDGTTGPLLPRIQQNYHLNFAVVSLLFVFACIGFIAGGLTNVYFTDKFGFGRTIVVGCFVRGFNCRAQRKIFVNFGFASRGAIAQIVGYSMMAPAPPFPVLVTGYVINGFGIALQDAQANGFCAALQNSSAKMNFIHAAYGLGALSAPLIATQFAQLNHWSFHYLTSLGISIANLLVLVAVFKLRTQDDILTRNGQPPAEVGTSQQSTMRQILGMKSVHLLAFFILVYVGIEVTIGGWIVTFIINTRGGGPSSGYISTGFFGGLTAGRLVLHYATRFIPEKSTIFLYALLSIGLELTIWLVPSLIGNAVSVSLIGFFLGPMYPTVMNQSGIILPRWLLTGAIGWIAGFGQAGSAALPFMTGALANKFGIDSLQPLLIAAMVVMVALWVLVTRGQRRMD